METAKINYPIINFFFVVVFTLIVSTINSESIEIHSADDLIDFSNEVNSGSTYSGTTVYLESDIEFDSGLSELFNPIGNITSCYFNGTFDGQGYTISNLILSSSSQHTGLFGYSTGTTIKNVVIDKSCSFSNNIDTKNGDVYMGSIVGLCSSSSNPCTIANTMNMGNVTFSGSTSSYLYIGGISGYSVTSITNLVTVKNSVNYGTVTNTGFATNGGYLGGIVGYCGGFSSGINCNIQNCVNIGNLINQDSLSTFYLGGIVGSVYDYALVENCVSTGELIDQQNNFVSKGFVGFIGSSQNITITHCLCTHFYNCFGPGSSATSGVSAPNYSMSISLSITIVNNLNEYSGNSDGFNKWIFNPNEKEVSFNINSEKAFTLASQLILLPDLDGNSEHTFSGWFTDSSCTNKFDSDDVPSDTTLYGYYVPNNYTVTFDFGNGTTLNETVEYDRKSTSQRTLKERGTHSTGGAAAG